MNQTYLPNYGYPPAYGPQGRPAPYGAPQWYPPPQQPAAPPAQPVAQMGGFAVQPVTRKEEALAVIADPMLSGVLMPDLERGVIYVKRFNPNTGASDFGEFALKPSGGAQEKEEEKEEEKVEYVTTEEFKRVVEPLAREVAALRKGGAHDE